MILFVILIVVASVALGFIVLIQNPKGGGLASNVGGLSNQFMGVKQTTDVLEKGTWIFAALIALLCIFSTVFLKGRGDNIGSKIEKIAPPAQPQAPQNAAPLQGK
jgi:preprotein translocase subunit SecG